MQVGDVTTLVLGGAINLGPVFIVAAGVTIIVVVAVYVLTDATADTRLRLQVLELRENAWHPHGVDMKKDVAEKINNLMLEYGAKLDESVRLVMQSCTDDEFQSYRAAVAQIMGTMLVDVMEPIYLEHPELKPAELEE